MLEILQALMGAAERSPTQRRCLVVNESGEVINAIVIDLALLPEQQWQPTAGLTLIASDEGGPGWRWDGERLIDPNPAPEPPAPVGSVTPGEGMTIV